MAVRDKELIINGKAVRSPEQQVYKNMKDIEELKENIKPEYTTNASLTSSSVSLAIASTNAPEGTTEGWLLTQDGLKFKITGGDDTNLLLEFYADLKGPQGEDGAALNIDDSTTSATKVWSSQKTNSEIGSKIQNDTTGSPSSSKTYSQKVISDLESSGIAWTATDIDGDSKVLLSLIYLGNQTALTNVTLGGRPKLKVDDLVVFVDGDLKAKTLYRVSYISLDTVKATLVKVCDFGGGGKQLYQHNLYWTREITRYYNIIYVNTIVNDKPTMSASDFIDYLGTNNYVYNSSLPTYKQIMFKAWGYEYDKNNDTQRDYYGVVKEDNFNIKAYIQNGSGTQQITDSETWTFVDDAQPL